MNPMPRHIFREIGTDRLLDISMVGVEENSRGQGVATNLIQRSILLGGCLGYRGIMAQPTSRYTVLQPASPARTWTNIFFLHEYDLCLNEPYRTKACKLTYQLQTNKKIYLNINKNLGNLQKINIIALPKMAKLPPKNAKSQQYPVK